MEKKSSVLGGKAFKHDCRINSEEKSVDSIAAKSGRKEMEMEGQDSRGNFQGRFVLDFDGQTDGDLGL